MIFKNILLVLFLIHCVFCAKHYLFKKCEQSGFCQRNRVFGRNVQSSQTFSSQYSINPESLNFETMGTGFVFNGEIRKRLPKLNEDVQLPFELSIVKGNSIRLKVDEKRSVKFKNVNPKRYNETSKWAFENETLLLIEKSSVDFKYADDKIIIKYGDNHEFTAELIFNPVRLNVYFKGELQMIVNDQQFLNFEHFRVESENFKHISDVEIDFNMFEDNFKDSEDDKLPFGPESVALDFTFKGFKNLYGIPEHSDSLKLKDTSSSEPYRLFNVDIFEYEVDSRLPMYGSIPLMTASKPGVSIGVFWVNAADTYVDIDTTSSPNDSKTHWISENGVLDVVISVGSNPSDINRDYGLITGYPQLPQIFSLGYHQCRWNYNDEKDVLNINNLMDEYQIPYDTIWLDVEYTDSKKYFTWQPDSFPHPEEMLAELDRTGRNLVVLIDPHMKVDYFVSDELIKRKITMNDKHNKPFHGHCWPGESLWIDTLNPKSQMYWDELHSLKEGSFLGKADNIYIWNDMSEPSIFDGPETTAPKDNLHWDGWEHRSIHNINGLTFHETTYKSLTKRLKDLERQRPFILTRSYFAGSQRTAAMWTGDNMSKWEYLKISIPMVLTSNVVNMPFSGVDVGGFFGNPSKELLTRWYQAGIWYPFFRAHAHIDSRRREPWVPGDPYTSIIRDAIRLRYSLLPVYYTGFYQANRVGAPIIKPLYYEAPHNLDSYSVDDQFFLADSGIMVKPVTDQNIELVMLYLPDNEKYYDYTNGILSAQAYELSKPGYINLKLGLSDIPMLIKGGNIIPRKMRYRRSTMLMENDPYTLTITLSSNNTAKGNLYIDDGKSFNYLNGNYIDVAFSATNEKVTGNVYAPNKEYLNLLVNITIETIHIVPASNVKQVEIEQDGDNWIRSTKASNGILTIKKPNLKIYSNWSIKIAKTQDFDHDEL